MIWGDQKESMRKIIIITITNINNITNPINQLIYPNRGSRQCRKLNIDTKR
jgi:hypothetical protein